MNFVEDLQSGIYVRIFLHTDYFFSFLFHMHWKNVYLWEHIREVCRTTRGYFTVSNEAVKKTVLGGYFTKGVAAKKYRYVRKILQYMQFYIGKWNKRKKKRGGLVPSAYTRTLHSTCPENLTHCTKKQNFPLENFHILSVSPSNDIIYLYNFSVV